MRFIRPLFFTSISTLTLLLDTKAISIPEKKPENSSDTSAVMRGYTKSLLIGVDANADIYCKFTT